MLLVAAVVLVAVDLARLAVLLTIDLRLLLCSQLPTVSFPVVAHFLIDLGFVVFQMGGFARRQLPALDALRDAVLLIFGALADLALWISILHGRVVLVLIDLFAKLILLLV